MFRLNASSKYARVTQVTGTMTLFADPKLNSILQEGDILHDVDGTVLLRRPPAEVAELLLGPEGSTINVGFMRGQKEFVVPLVRRPSSNRRQTG